MTHTVAGDGGESSGERTVLVGVKLDSQSRELLTWTLVNLAPVGGRVIALHVLNNSEIVDRDGKSSLFSLVKAFDSIIEVYEGFCNLKQVDLKLKICRGSSVKKVLVREAKSYNATEVVVGTAQTHYAIRSSASVAKYCAKKLSKDCSVFAVRSGKVVFYHSGSRTSMTELDQHGRNGLVDTLLGSFSKNIKGVDDDHLVKSMLECQLDLALDSSGLVVKSNEWSCSICSPVLAASDDSSARLSEHDDDNEISTAIVPVLETASGSVSKESSEVKLGWPLLRRAILQNRTALYSSQPRQLYLAQRAALPPNICSTSVEDLTHNGSDSDCDRDQSSELDAESGAIMLNGNENASVPPSPDCIAKTSPDELKGLDVKYSAICRLFNFQELISATSNFTTGNMIGRGGSSRVYKGCLPDGKEIAVKILKPSKEAVKEFVLEIEILTSLHHNNIISLFGFCFTDNHLLLVYDFVPRGSLEENLQDDKKELLAFGWNERYRVAIGVADALDYLHSREGQPIIHRDVKSSNILLSNDFEPQLSDFGLAKWASATSTYITCSNVAGTFGYLAPEYFMYGKVNEKIDIYAYGVVLLELLSGRKPISNNCPKGEESLVIWAKPILHSDKFAQLLDPNLGSNYDLRQVERMVLAASLCTRRAPRARPQMSLVLKLLRGDTEAVKWARMQVNASEASEIRQDSISPEGLDAMDDDAFPQPNLQSHLNLALLGVEEDLLSISSFEQSISLEDYLRGRSSRASSLN